MNQGVRASQMLARTPENTQNTKIVKIFCFMLRTNLATRRTVVRLRANKKSLKPCFCSVRTPASFFPIPLKGAVNFYSSSFYCYFTIFTVFTSNGWKLRVKDVPSDGISFSSVSIILHSITLKSLTGSVILTSPEWADVS